MVMQLQFAGPSPQQRRQDTYSLEQLSILNSANGAQFLELFVFNLDPDLAAASGVLGSTTRFALRLEGVSGGDSRLTMQDAAAVRGLFLGRQVTAGVATGFSIIAGNVDLDVMDVLAQGYVWGPRSVSLPGGVQRPAQGLYRV